ncbi:hypothetical protein [Salisediminibacterium halotolerans]|uniref:hypothetical protein n=1 Tax=Salisediminibacterium halotolerans TaxID=517425 RepID=UPI000EACFB07|nr:hypothetical protein [Salisediminibacterium halotolerans]RLJ74125.1 hypothetical protein BCL39_1412 [Actinophytocola xinjiangensis]RPE87782.1 hypothetical protein EDD67_1519 [Salisediminibacterium halotolerans]TWG34962.1 hypothetical protein BCL52_1409 [Salisediminibacterium halotolerans]GEL07703.1 hypothetical protein SHA02_11190 [Salisediminibacterium halotolerans]
MFPPYETWTLGPLSLQTELIFLLLTALIGIFTFSLYLKYIGAEKEKDMSDNITWAVLAAIGVFKFWPVITSPALLTDPMNLIYFTGGAGALPAAVIVFAGVMTFFFFRRSWPVVMWESLLVSVMTAAVVYFAAIVFYGTVSPLSVGYNVNDEVVHPVNLYAAYLLALTLAGLPVFFQRRTRWYAPLVYLIAAAGAIAFLLQPFYVSS